MTILKKPLAVAVFCGAKLGSRCEFAQAARALAGALHKQGWSLVYVKHASTLSSSLTSSEGGGTVGLMGEISRTLVELSGPQAVHGIIPQALVSVEQDRNPETRDEIVRERVYGSVTIVKDMHARKARMAEEAGAFVGLPGGFGTMEEVMEIITWNFLGMHDKPIVLFNVDGFYDDILRWVQKAVSNGFVDNGNSGIVVAATTAEEVITAIKDYQVASSRHNIDWDTK